MKISEAAIKHYCDFHDKAEKVIAAIKCSICDQDICYMHSISIAFPFKATIQGDMPPQMKAYFEFAMMIRPPSFSVCPTCSNLSLIKIAQSIAEKYAAKKPV